MAEILGNVVKDAGKSEGELLGEIYQLRKELHNSGRTDIEVTVNNDVGRPLSELLVLVFQLRNELINIKRSKSSSNQSKKKKTEVRKTNLVFNAETARNAFIYSEILGKPLSKRRY